MFKDRLHTIFYVIWACHLYSVSAGTLPTAQGFIYKKI